MKPEETIVSRFATVVAHHGGRPAISTPDAVWTYEELDQRANAIAAAIQNKVPGPGKVVGVLVDHGPESIAAILGVLKSGHLYTVLDPAVPGGRLRTVWSSTRGEMLLAGPNRLETAGQLESSERVIRIEETMPSSRPAKTHETMAGAGAVLLFTSGSTGEPKAVWQTHAGLLHHTEVYTDLIGLTSEDRLSLLTPGHLAASTTAIFGALLNGATLCPFRLREQGIDRLPAWLVDQRISVWHTVPTVFRRTLRVRDPVSAAPLDHLRIVRLGGEPVLRCDVELFRRHCPRGARLLHAYSSTETGLACALLIGHDEPLPEGRVPVGRPVNGVTVELVGHDKTTAPTVDSGQIVIRSDFLPPGYWHNSQSRGDAAIRHRFITADVGRWTADGMLEHLGRADQLVKIRGQRVDLMEIEAALRSIPGVEDTAAVALDTPDGGKRLVAYFTASPGSECSPGPLRRRLRELLPSGSMPDRIVSLPHLPVTAGGKVDRRSLPAPGSDMESARNPGPTARDWFEKQVAAIWESVLGKAPIGRQENFFDLGGGSIESAQVLARIDDEFAVSLPPSILAEAGTVESVARLLAARTIGPAGRSLVRLRAGGSRPPLFLVHGGKGDVAMFGQLARRIEDRPVLAFQSKGLSGECWPLMSIERMAEAYVEELVEAYPTGPVLLAGTCMGGLIALEMGGRLIRHNREVRKLILIDTNHPQSRRRDWRDRTTSGLRNLGRILRWAVLRALGHGRDAAHLPAYRRFVHAMNGRARRRCRPARFPGVVHLLVAAQGVCPDNDGRLQMRETSDATGVSFIDAARTRLLLPPEVDRLAEELELLLSNDSLVSNSGHRD